MTGSTPPRKLRLCLITEEEYLADAGSLTKDDFPQIKGQFFKYDDRPLLRIEAQPERILYHLVNIKGATCNNMNLKVQWIEDIRSVRMSCKIFKYN
jgi:hypothetical protein